MSLIEKIDKKIKWCEEMNKKAITIEFKNIKKGLEMARGIILSEQKEPKSIMLTSKSTLTDKPLTIGDKIRESNESLVEWYANRVNLYVCGESVTVNPLNKEKCLNYLNQPYTE